MKKQIFFWSITSALAGFLFGFDTVVISGAEQTIQKLWNLSDAVHGLVIGSALYGTVLGALLGGFPTDMIGRRRTLLSIGVLYVISALGCAFAGSVQVFFAARFIGGLGIGISTVASPLYISEIAPPTHRGRLAGMFQFNIVLGIVIAYASNAFFARIGGDNAWRWMLGVAAIPSLIYAVMCFGLPESPRWLITHKKDRAAGLSVLKLIEPEKSDAQLSAHADEILSASRSGQTAVAGFLRLRIPILLAFLIAFFNQLSGINAILYFAPRIFEMAGLGEKAAMLQSVGIGVTNLVFTFVGLWLIDRLGRRTLLYIGSFGYIISLSLTAWAFFTQHSAIVPFCIFAFIAAHAVGQGTVIWVFISEIFPNRFRAAGQTLGSSTHWIFAALLTSVFPLAVKKFAPGYIFAFFCGMMVLQLLWVIFMVPETKGVPLEDMQRKLGVEFEPESPAAAPEPLRTL
jgi:SP family arabinose:H+ symporter-like MFS transporter